MYQVKSGIWFWWVSDCWNSRTEKEKAPDTSCSYRFSEVLILGNNALNGTIPRELTNLSLLRQLSLEDNRLSGPPLPPINGTESYWNNLEELFLARNLLSGTFSMEFGLLSSLKVAHFIDNPIQGTLPTELGLVRNLERISFSESPNLYGQVPSEIGLLPRLNTVFFANTSISGTIPTEVGRLSSLLVLVFTHCNLNGPLPNEIENLTSLRSLLLRNSTVSGTIPSVLGTLKNLGKKTARIVLCYSWAWLGAYTHCLENLELNENDLQGTVPTELLLLTNLDALNLYGNKNLTGPFTCPAYVEICGVSCNNGVLPECRELE